MSRKRQLRRASRRYGSIFRVAALGTPFSWCATMDAHRRSRIVGLCSLACLLGACLAPQEKGSAVAPESAEAGGAPVVASPPGDSPGPSLAGEPPKADGGASAQSPAGECVTQKVEAVVERVPVDIITIIDNSGSMQDEIDAVERNINVNLAQALALSGIDYRLILLSQHEVEGRALSICVTEPLSATPACPSTPDRPTFTERFFQYSVPVGSNDSLALLLATLDDGSAEEFQQAPLGWSAWLRPEATKVFLEITDDDSSLLSADEFLLGLSQRTEVFGTPEAPRFRFHSITGLREKVVPTEAWLPSDAVELEVCSGNDNTVTNAGLVYQELSVRTQGLRFPICQYTAFDSVFQAIATDVATHASLGCSFPIPAAPPGRELDLDKVAVSLTPGPGQTPVVFGQVESADACVPSTFYLDAAAGEIVLCPETCAMAQAGESPKLETVFTCESTIVMPPH